MLRPAIEIDNISKSFGNLRALDRVSFHVDEKSITILMGPNGSGKTTLINVIMGLYRPDTGRVTYKGREITGLQPHEIYRLGLARTFQVPALFWKLSVLDNIILAKMDHPGEGFVKSLFRTSWVAKEKQAEEEALKILELVGLSHMAEQPATSLSGGQMKLLEIARALMSGASTLLLDEPISGVNPTLAHDIFSKLLHLRKSYGITFLIVEHRLDIALSYADDAIALSYGRLITMGKPTEVTSHPSVIDAYLGG